MRPDSIENTLNTHLFLIDNFDSFSYNLADEFKTQGYDITIFRNSVDVSVILNRITSHHGPSLIILSPGPGSPNDAGCMPELIKLVQGKYPVLGICLGHQAIVEHYGGQIKRAPQVVHGKASPVKHNEHTIFKGLSNPLPVARYHSLMADNLPSELSMLAWYNDIPMAILHENDAMLGIQFHPESILTTQGSRLLRQSINYLSKLTISKEASADYA